MKKLEHSLKTFMFNFVIILFLLIHFAGSERVRAKVSPPTFDLKLINNGTSVEITIHPTENVDGYQLYMRTIKCPAYDKYRIGISSRVGGTEKKMVYTINILPPGEYSFYVVGVKHEPYSYYGLPSYDSIEVTRSTEKTITIKEYKEERKEKNYDFTNTKVGDTIAFGAYEQDGDFSNGKEVIEWIVIGKKRDKILVLSKFALDCIGYDMNGRRKWEKSTSRKWLNSYFYETAFTKNEQKMIKLSKINNPANQETGVKGGVPTKDKVFLLSINEVKKYISPDVDENMLLCKCLPTKYAEFQKEHDFYGDLYRHDNDNWWYLRTPGAKSLKNESVINQSGYISSYGEFVANNGYIRPAMWIRIKK